MKNNTLRTGLLVTAVATIGAFATYLQAATVSTTTSANILQPIGISKVADISFGDVYPDGTLAGTVTLDFAGGRTFGGGAAAGTTAGTSGEFTVTGEAGALYALTIPASIALTGPGTDMTVSLSNNSTGSLVAGTETFQIGGALAVGIAQTAGAYTATFDVTVNYN